MLCMLIIGSIDTDPIDSIDSIDSFCVCVTLFKSIQKIVQQV